VRSFVISIDRATFEKKRAELIAKGVAMPAKGDSGEASAKGVVVGFDFDGAEVLIDILRKPWYASEGAIEGKLRDWFKG